MGLINKKPQKLYMNSTPAASMFHSCKTNQFQRFLMSFKPVDFYPGMHYSMRRIQTHADR